MYHFMSMIAPVCNPLPSLGCQSYFFSYLHKTVGAVLYFSPNSCSSLDLNFVFVLPIECSSTVVRSDAPCLRTSFRSSLLVAAFSPEALRVGLADVVRPRPPGAGDVRTRSISSVSMWPFSATLSPRPKNPQILDFIIFTLLSLRSSKKSTERILASRCLTPASSSGCGAFAC